MNDIPDVWVPPSAESTLPKPVGSHLYPSIFLVLLFISLVAIAIPALYLLQNTKTANITIDNQIETPELLANCAFFFQVCPTTSKGVAELQTLDLILTEIDSPLIRIGPLLHPQLDQPSSIETPPSQIMTLIATKNNISPFLLLTLSELSENTVTKADTVNQVIEGAGEKSAWFSLQHQQMAQELLKIAQESGLDAAATDERYKNRTVKVGNREVQISSDISLATGIILQYLATHSVSMEDFQTKVSSFGPTYQQLFGIDPSSVERN